MLRTSRVIALFHTLVFTCTCYLCCSANSGTKSLLEIQQEQSRQLERERQKREENQQIAAKVCMHQTQPFSTQSNTAFQYTVKHSLSVHSQTQPFSAQSNTAF